MPDYDVSKQIADLNDPDPEIRYRTFRHISHGAYEKRDLPALLSPSIPFLSDPSENVRESATLLLYRIAEYGCDITPAVALLWEILDDPKGMIGEYAAKALTYHYLGRDEWKLLDALFSDPRLSIAAGALDALYKFQPREVEKAFLLLVRTQLEYPHPFIRSHVARTLGTLLFGNRNLNRAGISSLETLERLESQIEEFVWERRKELPPGPSIKKSRLEAASAFVMGRIAARKSELAKNKDGELLTGETVAKPRNSRGMYAAVRVKTCAPSP